MPRNWNVGGTLYFTLFHEKSALAPVLMMSRTVSTTIALYLHRTFARRGRHSPKHNLFAEKLQLY